MKQSWLKNSALVAAIALLAPVAVKAQDEKDKVKEKEKKEAEQIVITRKSGDQKLVIECNGDKVTINGKPIEEFKDDDVSVSRRKIKDALSFYNMSSPRINYNTNGDAFRMFTEESNHAMLGVSTEKSDKGCKISEITKGSAAEKIGLKKDDIITRINDTKVETPDALTKAIRSHKPGDKVNVSYLRDGKEQSASAELTKWNAGNFKLDMKDFDLGHTIPKVRTTPGTPYGQNFVWSGGSPKLGLSVQDTDDGKGVKVIEVDDDSNAAKAGVKEEDVISEVDGKAVNSTDEMVKIIKESKDKNSIMIKLSRGGKIQNIEVKMPKKIKTLDI